MTKNLMSSGYLSQRLQASVPAILDGLNMLMIDADLTLNGVPYFVLDGDAEDLLALYIADRKANAERHRGAKWTPTVDIPDNYVVRKLSDASGEASAP